MLERMVSRTSWRYRAGGETTTSGSGIGVVSRNYFVKLSEVGGLWWLHTDFGVESGLVEVLDNLLDGRDSAVPGMFLSTHLTPDISYQRPNCSHGELRCFASCYADAGHGGADSLC